MTKKYNIAIVGATGVVGTTLLSILAERNFPVNNIHLLASKRSAGEIIDFNKMPHVVADIDHFDFTQSEICFFCASNDVAEKYIPKATASGCVVIDKSSFYRNDPDVPLVVPEVNPDALAGYSKKNIIANPNCSTIPIVVALKPLYDAVGIRRMNIATYQSVSGSGKEGVQELAEQTASLLNGKPIRTAVYPQQIAFNVLPCIDAFEDNGYTKEEMKVVRETQKIFADATIAVNPTAVRVPVYYGHSAALHIETKNKISAQQVLDLLQHAPSVKVITGRHPYPTPVKDAAGNDFVYVGRIREDISLPHGLNLWVVADNLRKGAALNAVQIAECLVKNHIK